MNLTQLHSFIRVAEMGSFSQAAVVLEIAQPALSRQVRLLEAELGVTLLQRTGRGVVLTEAGKRLFDHGVSILQDIERAREDVRGLRNEPSGRVVLGLPPSIALLVTTPLVDAFGQRLPKARLAIVEGLSTHVVEWIATGRVDIGLVHNPSAGASVEASPVVDEPLCLVSPSGAAAGGVAGPAGPALGPSGAPLPFRALAGVPLVVPEPSHAIRKLLEATAVSAGVRLRIGWEVSSVPCILDLVRHGYGHAVLTRSALITSGKPRAFTLRRLVEPDLTSTLCVAVSALRSPTPLVRQVDRMLRELLLERLGHRRHAGSR